MSFPFHFSQSLIWRRLFCLGLMCSFGLTVGAQDACSGDREPPVANCPPSTLDLATDPGLCGAYAYFNITATDNCETPNQLRGYRLLGVLDDRSYFLSASSFGWQAALEDAALNGGHLVSITSLTENDLLDGNGQAWIGLTDQAAEGDMRWITGEALGFVNWQAGEPDDGMGSGQDHVAIQNDGTWTDLSSSTSLPYIMEVEGALAIPSSASLAAGNFFPVGMSSVTYTISDLSRNSVSCGITISVSDQEPPTFVDPPQDTVIDCTASVAIPSLTATDACVSGDITATLVRDTTIAGSCPQESTIVRSWEATDNAGNTATYIQTISVQDTTPPVPTCTGTVLMLDSMGMGQISVPDIDNGSSDNCSNNLSLRLSQTDFGCDDIGLVPVTLFVEDECGNVDSCTVDVDVQDNIAPFFTNCPADLTIVLDPGACRVAYDYNLEGQDNCTPSDQLLFSQLQGPPLGSELERETTTTFEFELDDGNGNSVLCSWSVSVVEFPVTNIVLACNDHINLSLDTLCEATIGADLVLEGDQYGCFEDYVVDLFTDEDMQQMLPGSPLVTLAEAGLTLYYRVTDPETGLSCWGTLLVEDKIAPQLLCDCPLGVQPDSAACEFFCFEDARFPDPIAMDNCGMPNLSFRDTSIEEDICEVTIIRRTWTASDAAGNSSQCTQEIRILPARLDQVMAPANFDNLDQEALDCADRCPDGPRPSCGNQVLGWNVIESGPYRGHPSPEDDFYSCNNQLRCRGTGMPNTAAACSNINVVFADSRSNNCAQGSSDGCFQIIRTWTLLNWCNGEVSTFDQIIKVSDNEGPKISDVEDVTISTDVWRCAADWRVPVPWMSDNCGSAPVSYRVEANSGELQLVNNSYVLKDLPLGVHELTYIAEDCCGNESRQIVRIEVVDDVPPVAVCDRGTVVDISTTTQLDDENLGLTKIAASSLDDGSFDNCSDQVWFKALRMDALDSNGNGKAGESVIAGDWSRVVCEGGDGDDDIRTFPPAIVVGVDNCGGPIGLTSHPNYQNVQSYFDDDIQFCCEDIVNGPIQVVFRVFDRDPSCYEFRNVFPASNPTFAAWYASNPHKAAEEYTGVLPEAMSSNDWPVSNAGPGPLYGHFSDCMVEVTVQDKLAPYVVAPPDVVISCDFWFAFDPDNPNDFTDELDAVFGKVVEGSADLADRDSITVRDRVCAVHPRFAEFAPANPFDDPCYDDLYDIFWGIDGYVLDNCEVDLEQTIVPDLVCGAGTITRSWRASDGQGNWSNVATQRIQIINCRDFYVPNLCWRSTPQDVGSCDFIGGALVEKLIEWPCDLELSRCQGPTEEVFLPENLDILLDQNRRPRFADANCRQLAVSYEDRVFTFVDSACLKIFRDWEVIDWCRYDNQQVPFAWQWTQVIKLLNQEGPTFDSCTQTVCGYGNPSSPATDQCSGEVTINPVISDDCSALADLRIDYKVDLFDDGQYDSFGYSDNYGSQYPFPNPDALPVRSFAAANYAITTVYPVGTHRILWVAEDGCGNANSCEYMLTVEDCKPPTPYCLPGISTIPMPRNAGGFVDLWASDFDLGSFDNCTDSASLRFAFSSDPNNRSIRRTCDVSDNGNVEELTVYVFDEAGNYATCLVQILLTDCRNQTQANISGAIQDEQGGQLEDVMVKLEGYRNEEQRTLTDGQFSFANLPVPNDYLIRPEKNIDPLNGVSTYDLVLISKHILGIEPLDSPYKLIAADVNRSGDLTAFDLVELRKLILFIDEEFADNTSWRFLPQNYNFPDPLRPFAAPFPEVYRADQLAADLEAHFVAIKTGDVNDSARPNQVRASEDRSGRKSLYFELEDAELSAGERRDIEWRIPAGSHEWLGYQFDLKIDPELAEIERVDPEAEEMSLANFGLTGLEEGWLLASWHHAASGPKVTSEDVLSFRLRLRAKQPLRLSEVLALRNDRLQSEAYASKSDSVEVFDLGLRYKNERGAVNNVDFVLHPNVPNPFRHATSIRFVLPEAQMSRLEVYDLNGRLMAEKEAWREEGHHEIHLDRSEWGMSSAGVYYYRLKTEQWEATRRMIVVD
ncbi:MAG: HYR domain-containing protein [Bacteroidota bacterium]